ncbi:hypothetical protein ACGRHY_05995 [Streptomyces sp. HK10]|uniref:hypothetical protein n=1 Tax=Streptomyces sp. HK10 TaxID=3373255 RepID=UPI003747C473
MSVEILDNAFVPRRHEGCFTSKVQVGSPPQAKWPFHTVDGRKQVERDARLGETAGQERFSAGLRMATHST